MRRLVQIVLSHAAAKYERVPKVVIVAPPHLCATNHKEMMIHFGPDAIAQSRHFAYWYSLRAEEEGVGFFDAATVARADPADGVHLDGPNTRAIGEGLVPVVKTMLGL
jgi:hypothetical protein